MQPLTKYCLHAIIMLMLSACSMQATKPVQGDAWTVCSEPRPQICTMEYMPVCGRDQAGNLKTYATGCTACADSTVLEYQKGECK